MLIKNSHTTNNRDVMNTDQIALKLEPTNVKQGNLILNMINSSCNYFYRRLFTDFVRMVISDDRINSAITFIVFPMLILLVKCLLPSLTFLLKSVRDFARTYFETIRRPCHVFLLASFIAFRESCS